jgi:hypothetical protein
MLPDDTVAKGPQTAPTRGETSNISLCNQCWWDERVRSSILDPFLDKVGFGRFRMKPSRIRNLRPSPQTQDFLLRRVGCHMTRRCGFWCRPRAADTRLRLPKWILGQERFNFEQVRKLATLTTCWQVACVTPFAPSSPCRENGEHASFEEWPEVCANLVCRVWAGNRQFRDQHRHTLSHGNLCACAQISVRQGLPILGP